MSHPRGDDYQARFDRLAAAGEDVHGEAAFVEARLSAGAAVLDAGCGTGRVAIELARRGFAVTGADRDPAMLATARRLAPDLDWVEADLAALDLGRRFDAVVLAGNVLLFVDPGTQGAVVARCAAHLAPGGLLVSGFSRRGYTERELDADLAAAGLAVVERYATWQADPWHARADYVLTVASTRA